MRALPRDGSRRARDDPGHRAQRAHLPDRHPARGLVGRAATVRPSGRRHGVTSRESRGCGMLCGSAVPERRGPETSLTYRPDNPLIAQGDRSVLLEVHAARYEAARDALCRFAELEKSPEHVHTYRISALSLWNAAAAGVTPERIGTIEALPSAQEPAPVPVPVDGGWSYRTLEPSRGPTRGTGGRPAGWAHEPVVD